MKRLQSHLKEVLNEPPSARVMWHLVSHVCTLMLMVVMLWAFDVVIQREREERLVATTKANACLATAKQCDAELVTCIGWQARVGYELKSLLERECDQ